MGGGPADNPRTKGAYIAAAKSVEWLTPPELLKFLAKTYTPDGKFDLDPSPYPRPKGYDGLKVPWEGSVYFNPPYGVGIRDWIRKAIVSYNSARALVVVGLLPARTDTIWFDEAQKNGRVQLIKGRVRYCHPSGKCEAAPFPSCLFILKDGLKPGIELVEVPGAGSYDDRQAKL